SMMEADVVDERLVLAQRPDRDLPVLGPVAHPFVAKLPHRHAAGVVAGRVLDFLAKLSKAALLLGLRPGGHLHRLADLDSLAGLGVEHDELAAEGALPAELAGSLAYD